VRYTLENVIKRNVEKVWSVRYLPKNMVLPKLLDGKDTQTWYNKHIFPLKIKNVGMNYLRQCCGNVVYIQFEHSICPVYPENMKNTSTIT
jgi:hypothetical protein